MSGLCGLCELCGEPITVGTEAERVTGVVAHRTCLLRSATGGIGHLENHRYWCLVMHDPDGGRSLYQSGLEVDDWVEKHGTKAAFAEYDEDGIPHPRRSSDV